MQEQELNVFCITFVVSHLYSLKRLFRGGVFLQMDHYFVHFKVLDLDVQVQSSSRGCICVLCCVSSTEYCRGFWLRFTCKAVLVIVTARCICLVT